MKKKLIEVALPLKAINIASSREKSIRYGNPSTMHLWWARRPLATARAVIFAQMVDDPSAHPDKFPSEELQEMERQRLFNLIEKLVLWENTGNNTLLQQARTEIWESWKSTCEENKDHPRASEIYNSNKLPAFHDPFAGGGALPLEAQRLGLETYASDLNPVAVLINKAMIEIPPKFAGFPPVNPKSRKQKGITSGGWEKTKGLAEDILYYGQWIRDQAEKSIGHIYPKVEITPEIIDERPDLRRYEGQKLTVIAWLWVRTVKSPNPAFSNVDVPLSSTFLLSSKPGKKAYIRPVIGADNYHFVVKTGEPEDKEMIKNGTKMARGANFRCIMSGVPITADHIKNEGRAKRMGVRLMAIVAEGKNEQIYLSPSREQEEIALKVKPIWKPDLQLAPDPRALWTPSYGLTTFGDLFTQRQLEALTTFSDLIIRAREQVKVDALAAGLEEDKVIDNNSNGSGAAAYADAIAIYLSLGVGRCANYWSSLTPWGGNFIVQTFGRQAIPMVWDYAEGNPFSTSTGNWKGAIDWIEKVISTSISGFTKGNALQLDAQYQTLSMNKVISTDPPYYDNIGYSDLSDFFYVWLRRSLKPIIPNLFDTLATPKKEELVAIPYRHGNKTKAEYFFLHGMTNAMHNLAIQGHPAFPITIYYAFKQSETENEGTASTGWETFLEAVINAGFTLAGTWPMRTERDQGLKTGSNVLASSIILVCRPKSANLPTITRREFLVSLKNELPSAIINMQHGNIAPVDLAQAAIGPGMAVYTRYSKVIDTSGKDVSVRDALSLINQTLDEILAEQEGDFDSDSRWAISWFEQYGFEDGEYGVAETLSKAKNTSIHGMVEAGILISKGGKVRLLKPEELPADWDPKNDARLTIWETVHQIIRVLQGSGEVIAAEIVTKLGNKADTTRELAYRLYTICERKKRAQDALSYNELVQSWPEILRLAKSEPNLPKGQTQLMGEE